MDQDVGSNAALMFPPPFSPYSFRCNTGHKQTPPSLLVPCASVSPQLFDLNLW